jgi:starvation-inducible DNA-binding protein
MSKTKSFPTRNDLSQAVRDKAVSLLNQHLADAIDLYNQIKQAHWNVKGPHFIALHELFDDLAEGVEGHVDTIAERATALGGTALGTIRLAAAASRLPEYPLEAVDGRQHLEALSARFATLAASVRAAIGAANDFGDVDTADLFTGVSRDLDKSLWFLEAHLQS